jgi:protein SCO1/2
MLFRSWTKAAGFSTIILAAAALLFFSRPASAGGANQSHFPNVELITQDGKTVHFYDDLIKGKIVAIDMIYTTCHYACPLETARLAQVYKKLGDRVGKDIFFYSITIDPEHDTPEVLKAYKDKFHIGPGWTFLTGKKEDILFLGRKLGLYTDASVNADGHVPYLLIGNEAIGQWMRQSSMDNPAFQARMIGDFLDNYQYAYQHAQPTEQKAEADGRPIQHFNTGKYLFGRDCVACHTVGHGDSVGPDLLGVTHLRSHEWLMHMIEKPDELLDGKDPIATAQLKKYNGIRMPNVLISDVDAGYIVSYLEEQTAAHDKEVSHGGPATATKEDSPGEARSPQNR